MFFILAGFSLTPVVRNCFAGPFFIGQSTFVMSVLFHVIKLRISRGGVVGRSLLYKKKLELENTNITDSASQI